MGSDVILQRIASDSNNSDGCECWFAAVNQCKQWAILSQASVLCVSIGPLKVQRLDVGRLAKASLR